MRSRSFWAGFSLGVATGAAGLLVALKVWADYWPLPEEPLPLPEWCPGIDPLEAGKVTAGGLQSAGAVAWSLCGDWQAHNPHERSTAPDYLADAFKPKDEPSWRCWACKGRLTAGDPSGHKPGCQAQPVAWATDKPDPAPDQVWCRGVDAVYPSSMDDLEVLDLPDRDGEPDWDQVPDEVESGAGEDSQAPDGWSPGRGWVEGRRGDGATCGHSPTVPCPIGLSLGEHHHSPEGCHAQGRPHTGPCINVVNHSPWIPPYRLDPQAPVLDPEVVERWRAGFRRISEDMGRAPEPLSDVFAGTSPSTLGGVAQCDRDFPHSVHVWTGGVCTGIKTAGGASDA